MAYNCRLASTFTPAPRNSNPEIEDGMLKLEDPSYHLLPVDADGAARQIVRPGCSASR